MKKEDIKKDDLLFHVNLEFGEYLISEVFVEEINEKEGCYFGIKCKVSSDDKKYNGKIIFACEDELFETRKEALEYALEKSTEYQDSYKKEVVRATIELEQENIRVNDMKEKEQRRMQIFSKVLNLWHISRKVCKHPGYSLMFMEEFDNEEFLNALQIVCDAFERNIKEQDEGAEKLLKAIFGEEENLTV